MELPPTEPLQEERSMMMVMMMLVMVMVMVMMMVVMVTVMVMVMVTCEIMSACEVMEKQMKNQGRVSLARV